MRGCSFSAARRWFAKYEGEEGETLPLGIILCTGSSAGQIELLELGAADIHVAEYLTVLLLEEMLQRKVHDAIAATRLRVDLKE